MRNKRIRKDGRRGVALEMAITFLLLIFALCSLMTTLALVSRSRLDTKKKNFLQATEINQMAENFCAEVAKRKNDPEHFSAFTYYYTGQVDSYYARIDTVQKDIDGDGDTDDVHTLHIYTVKNSGYARLTVKAYADEDGCHVLTWSRFDYDNYS